MELDLSGPDDVSGAAVLLHPDPRMGGSRHHPLVDDLWRTLPARGVGAIRFDIDDVDLDRARGQVVSAIDGAARRWPERPVVLVGYSFGAGVAARVDDERVAAWYLVAPQAPRLVGSHLAADLRPVTIVVPEDDQFSPPDVVRRATEGWPRTTVTTVAGDHFLGMSLDGIVASCGDWVVELVGSGS